MDWRDTRNWNRSGVDDNWGDQVTLDCPTRSLTAEASVQNGEKNRGGETVVKIWVVGCGDTEYRPKKITRRQKYRCLHYLAESLY